MGGKNKNLSDRKGQGKFQAEVRTQSKIQTGEKHAVNFFFMLLIFEEG